MATNLIILSCRAEQCHRMNYFIDSGWIWRRDHPSTCSMLTLTCRRRREISCDRPKPYCAKLLAIEQWNCATRYVCDEKQIKHNSLVIFFIIRIMCSTHHMRISLYTKTISHSNVDSNSHISFGPSDRILFTIFYHSLVIRICFCLCSCFCLYLHCALQTDNSGSSALIPWMASNQFCRKFNCLQKIDDDFV